MMFYMHRYKQSTYKTVYTDSFKTYLLDHNFTYNRLPEDELPSSKHVEIIKIKLLLSKGCILLFFISYNLLEGTVQQT